MTKRNVEICTMEVGSDGVHITTANGDTFHAEIGSTVRLNYQFEDEFVAVLEELQRRNET